MEPKTVEFTIPLSLKDFIFDLHQATRMSMRIEDVSLFYEFRFKEMNEKFFEKPHPSPWPEARLVAPECNHDEEFLHFYRELIARHLYGKMKPQLSDHLESWTTYSNLFGAILSWRDPAICLTVQWINDIMQEFVYQFQGFCQFRTVGHRSSEEFRLLEENRQAWNLPSVMNILRGLIRQGNQFPGVPLFVQFGYFASVELGRLECLLGDYTASLQSISPATLGSRSDLIVQIPTCYANVYYHAGVSQLMLRRYVDAVETFSEIALHIHSIVKASSRDSARQDNKQLQRIFDKILGLLAVSIALCPAYRVDDQVKELVDAKYSDKLRRLNSGDDACLRDLFEGACPKFVSPVVPDYSAPANLNAEAFAHQSSVFLDEAKQQILVLKLRSYLRLYAAIDLSKLSRISDTTEEVFFSQLLSYKHKTMQIQARDSADSDAVEKRTSTSDVNFYVQDRSLVIESSSSRSSRSAPAERYFVAGVRKHADIVGEVNRFFARIGL